MNKGIFKRNSFNSFDNKPTVSLFIVFFANRSCYARHTVDVEVVVGKYILHKKKKVIVLDHF